MSFQIQLVTIEGPTLKEVGDAVTKALVELDKDGWFLHSHSLSSVIVPGLNRPHHYVTLFVQRTPKG